MILNLHDVAQAIYEANCDAGIETVYAGPWAVSPLWVQRAYIAIAGDVLTKLNLPSVANEADHVDHS